MGRYRIAYRVAANFSLRACLIFLVNILFFGQANAASKYGTYGLPGEAIGMRFKVYAYNDEKAEQILAKAEDTYNRLIRGLGQGGLMNKDCLIFFWKEREGFLRESGKLTEDNVSEWAGAFTTYHFKRGEAAIFAYDADKMFSSILPHEITHQVLAQGLCFTGTPRIPNWLNEGLAQYMEEDKNESRLFLSSALKQNNYFNFKDLTVTYAYAYPSENISLFYAQSLSLVEYLLENYPGERFWSLARRLAQEMKPIEKALKGAYWPDIDNPNDLEQKWLTWVKGKQYYQESCKIESAEAAGKTGDYLPLTSQQREIIKEMETKVKKVNDGYIWRSQHFSVRMEYPSRKELGIKDAKDLEDIYGAILFILEEAWDLIGDEMEYHPSGRREVYLYAPGQYSILKGDSSREDMLDAHRNEIVMEIKAPDRIRHDLVGFLYNYYAYIVLLNKSGTAINIKLYKDIAIEWEKRGERRSAWNKKR